MIREEDWEEDVVTISVDEYIRLNEGIGFLMELKKCGVENWEGFDEALSYWKAGRE